MTIWHGMSQQTLNEAAVGGWEAIGITTRHSGSRSENFLLLRKPKASTSRAAWWKFWK